MTDKVDSVLRKSIIVNIFLIFLKIVVGLIGNSTAMIADGINSISDFITDFIAMIGNRMSNRPASSKHPYGYGQIEYLTSILVGLFILLMGINLVVRAFSSEIKNPDYIVFYVSILVFLVKYIFSLYLFRKGEEYRSSILISSGIESKATAFTTLFVIISFILSRFSSHGFIYLYSDNICTFLIGIYVIYASFRIIKENAVNIIGVNEMDIDLKNKIEKKILSNDGVISINNINLLKYGSYYSADICIVMKDSMKLKDINSVVSKIKKQLCNRRTSIRYINISVIPN